MRWDTNAVRGQENSNTKVEWDSNERDIEQQESPRALNEFACGSREYIGLERKAVCMRDTSPRSCRPVEGTD
jgi:hypothetical protein